MSGIVHADTRWRGAFGIGRYSTEVLGRLTVPWEPIQRDGSPSSPIDAFRPLPKDAKSGIVYTPGYNAFVGARREVLTLHDLIHLAVPGAAGLKYRAYYSAVIRPVIRRSGVVLTVSDTSADVIREWLRDDRVDVVNCGNGVSSSEFSADGPRQQAQGPYLMYVGNLRIHKNVDVILRALAIVPEVELRMVIPPQEHEAARARVAELGIADRVQLLSGVPDAELAANYRGAAATLMPSTLEGFGLPPLESIMCATPVVYWAGCAAVAETVGARGTAVDSAHDHEAWAEAIQGELDAQRRVEPPAGQYDWAETAKKVSAVLNDRL